MNCIPYTVYSEGGGVGKTVISTNLAHAHVEQGDKTLLIDLDQQVGSASKLLDVDHNRGNPDADDLSLHIVDRPKGDFFDLIETTDQGIDVIPSHNRLEDIDDLLDSAAQVEETTRLDDDYEYPRYEQLFRVFSENGVAEEYDVIIIDPNAKADDVFHLAVNATRNIVMPVEPSGKGASTVQGLRESVTGLENELGIDVSVLAAIPNDINERANDDQFYLEQLEESQFDVPTKFGHRRSLFRGCWREQVTAFDYVNEIRDRQRDREVRTLEKFHEIVDHIKEVTGATEREVANQ